MSKEKTKKRWLFFGRDKYTYDTIEELVKKGVGLKIGEVVTLNGYYTAGDGANHKRIIANEDDGSGVQLSNKLWACICENTISLKMLGCRKNDEVDIVLNKISQLERELTIIIDDYYLINNSINPTSNKKIIFTPNSTLKVKQQTAKNSVTCFYIQGKKNIYIENPVLIGDSLERPFELSNEWNHGIRIEGCENILIVNPTIKHHYGDGIYIGGLLNQSGTECKHVRVKNAYIYDVGRNGFSITGCIDTKIYNSYVEKVDKWLPKSCVDIEPENNINNDFVIDIEFINSHFKNVENFSGIIVFAHHNTTNNKIIFRNTICEAGDNSFSTSNGKCDIYFDNLEIVNPNSNVIQLSLNKKSTLRIDRLNVINACVGYESENNKPVGGYDTIFRVGDVSEFGNIYINEMNCNIDNPKQNPALIYDLTSSNKLTQGNGNGCININSLRTNKLLNIYRDNSSIQIIKINDYQITDVVNRKKIYENNPILYKYSTFAIHNIVTDDNITDNITFSIRDNWIKDLVNTITNHSSKNVKLIGNSKDPAEFAEGEQIIKPNGYIKFVYSSIDNKVHILEKYESPTQVSQLNAPYMATKMQQEGVYEDYISYMDEKTLYDKQQRKLSEQRQLAYEEALKENPNLTYEEFMSVQPMTLNLVEEPQPSEALKRFMKKYL